MSGPITRLSHSTQALLRSTIILTSLPQIVSELVQNALDAGSTEIGVSVDVADWMCLIRDNGHGMTVGDLAYLGKEGDANRYGEYGGPMVRPHG